jgi:hypothetical protein
MALTTKMKKDFIMAYESILLAMYGTTYAFIMKDAPKYQPTTMTFLKEFHGYIKKNIPLDPDEFDDATLDAYNVRLDKEYQLWDTVPIETRYERTIKSMIQVALSSISYLMQALWYRDKYEATRYEAYFYEKLFHSSQLMFRLTSMRVANLHDYIDNCDPYLSGEAVEQFLKEI